MRKTLIVARREMANYLFSPMAYVVGAVFLAVSSILFFYGFPPLRVDPVFVNGGDASLKTLFYDLTMRLVSEEYRSGTIEKLATAPISETAIIVGKFLGVLALYAMLLATTLVFLILVASFGKPDPGVALMGYLGMLLLGAAFLAVGLFTSCLTRYQVLAAVVGIVILSSFTLLMQTLAEGGSEFLPFYKLNVMTHLRDFATGFFDTRAVVYFLSATVLFLFLSVKALESRRWR